MEFYYIFSILISIFFAGNLTFHLYNIDKHKKLLNYLFKKDFIIIKNIESDIDTSSSKSIYNYQKNKTNVIFFNDHIFLLTKSKIFKIAQPILQISRINNDENFSWIWEEINYISMQNIDKKIRIKGFAKRGLVKIDYKIILDFNKTKFELENLNFTQNK